MNIKRETYTNSEGGRISNFQHAIYLMPFISRARDGTLYKELQYDISAM